MAVYSSYDRQVMKKGVVLKNKTRIFDGAGGPLSGTYSATAGLGGTGATKTGDPIRTPLGSIYIDKTNGTYYYNEGSSTTPYWTPLDFSQQRILGAFTDFRGVPNTAVTDTAAATLFADGSGFSAAGLGHSDTDGGCTIAYTAGGAVASMICSATTNDWEYLRYGDANGVIFKPGTNGPIVIDALVSQSSAITLRRVFCGFAGTQADAMTACVTGSTTTLTLVNDDVVGLFFDVGLTATDRWYVPHNKADEAASIATTATGVDTGVTVAAAGTYQRLRVQVSAAGVATCFIDKVQVSQISAASSTTVALGPILAIGTTSGATKTMLVKQVACWGIRASGA